MKLFKNVDIKDLKSIVANGILPISATRNNNWDYGKRGNNSTDVVYLFDTKCNINSFTKYGVALIEVEVEGAVISEIAANDANKDLYNEYIVSKVEVSNIKKIYIPEIFKEHIDTELISGIEINWCGIEAEVYGNEYALIKAEETTLVQFAKTAILDDSQECNFFRGVSKSNRMIDLYNIKYIF